MMSIQLAQADTGYLPTARVIANYIGSIMKMGLGISGTRAVQMANAKIDPAQRFYMVEYNHAALLLAQEFSHISQSSWVHHLGNNMGYRLVEIPICRYGLVVDPVTRQCVKEYVAVTLPEPEPEPEPSEELEPTEEEEKRKVSGTVLILVALVALFILRGR